ncbi:MAG: prepilin-type N-terminal cleavage/methylation domain-containing protein, partial [Zoogloea sp.]|nr:prepilin-type N-terminal cleavage/methylation domain-containing protein [Zoogloea sp.]
MNKTAWRPKMRRTAYKRHNGFSLLELMIAVV